MYHSPDDVPCVQVPAPFNLEAVMKAKSDDPSALHVVLFQEVRACRLPMLGVVQMIAMGYSRTTANKHHY
jgi:hypothetical protein